MGTRPQHAAALTLRPRELSNGERTRIVAVRRFRTLTDGLAQAYRVFSSTAEVPQQADDERLSALGHLLPNADARVVRRTKLRLYDGHRTL